MNILELCCGSAALSMSLIGCVPPVPYMGSKRKVAKNIIEATGIHMLGPVNRIRLCDTGPWGIAWQVLSNVENREEISKIIDEWCNEDQRSLWDRLRNSPPPLDPIQYTATFLTLQRFSYRSKPIYIKPDNTWKTHGFAKTDAYGSKPRPTFNWNILPQLPTVAQRIRNIPSNVCIQSIQTDVINIRVPERATGWVVYIDPPYRGLTEYGHTLSRDAVIHIAMKWHIAGAIVIISEAEPIQIPRWKVVNVTPGKMGGAWKTPEIITTNINMVNAY